jgi:hypothetical protein
MLGIILVVVILCPFSSVLAQDPNDPGNPDTLYFTVGSMSSPTGESLWIWPGVFPQDVVIHVNAWNDNEVMSIVCVFTDTCNGPPCDADLDPTRNNGSDHPKCFEGSRVEYFDQMGIKLSYFPPEFYFWANIHGAEPLPPGDGLLATLTFTVFDTGRICLDTSFFPPANYTTFMGGKATGYIPIFKQKDFVIANCGYSCGDPNYDGITNVSDVVYVINYVFRSGPQPCMEKSGDVNCDDIVDILDITYFIDYLFKNGPEPECCP